MLLASGFLFGLFLQTMMTPTTPLTRTMAMAEAGSQRGKRMWPAPQTADFLFSLSNVALIVGLALTVVATIGSVWMANVRDGYLKRDLAEADRRIAEANAAGEEARSAAAANARAAEAALQLERFRAPRTLTDEQRQHVAARVREFAGQEYTAVLASGGFDVRILWIALDNTLTAAGWSRQPPAGLAVGPPACWGLCGVRVGHCGPGNARSPRRSSPRGTSADRGTKFGGTGRATWTPDRPQGKEGKYDHD
jgi:hypothetical protein